MRQLPDTNDRVQHQKHITSAMWCEHGWRCYCGNIVLVGSSKHLYCSRCDRFWERRIAETILD